jgi:hypothetical protein
VEENKVMKWRYKMEYRNTRMGGMTVSIAICPKCRKVIEPSRKERSKTGTHGKDYYAHEHELSFITLIQSNSGKRRIIYHHVPYPIMMECHYLWIIKGLHPEEIKERIQQLLNEIPIF